MNGLIRTAITVAAIAAAAQASAQVTFYENDGYGGRTFSTQSQVDDLYRFGFNDRASSVRVERDSWQLCEDSGFRGRCVVLGPGEYPSLAAMGLNDRISSVRLAANPVAQEAPRYGATAPYDAAPPYDARRRRGERLYQANVTNVRAVVGAPEKRCWMEKEEVREERRANVPGAIVGGLIGGILGHQVGSGTGRSVLTAGGAVTGAVLGGRYGRGDNTTTRDVERCSETPAQAKPAFWDVTYEFRGQEHHVQMTAPPGATVQVNRQGEPRA